MTEQEIEAAANEAMQLSNAIQNLAAHADDKAAVISACFDVAVDTARDLGRIPAETICMFAEMVALRAFGHEVTGEKLSPFCLKILCEAVAVALAENGFTKVEIAHRPPGEPLVQADAT